MAKPSLVFLDKDLKADFSLEQVLVGIKGNLMTLVKLYHIRYCYTIQEWGIAH